MEIGFRQEDDVLGLFGEGWGEVSCFKNLAGIPRIITAQKSS